MESVVVVNGDLMSSVVDGCDVVVVFNWSAFAESSSVEGTGSGSWLCRASIVVVAPCPCTVELVAIVWNVEICKSSGSASGEAGNCSGETGVVTEGLSRTLSNALEVD